jgi:hypothetical protein
MLWLDLWRCVSRGSTEAVSTPEPAMGEDFNEKSVAVPGKYQGPDKLRCSIHSMDELAPYDIIFEGSGGDWLLKTELFR